MNTDRWREITRIYGAVVAHPPQQRAEAVVALCGGDADLRREIESLLDESAARPMVLGRPPWDAAEGLGIVDGKLAPGTVVGSYHIVSLLGVGGMGEVYRARDTRLNRDVAIKILPVAFASDPDRLARFRREAQALASLNHPNIGAIYGLEESVSGPAAAASVFLLLELVEGEHLGHRIARGAMALDEALPIARQIAGALEAAHARGIVHRDLKPANIMVRPDGTVKVLDFGLAKITGTDRAGLPGETAVDPERANDGATMSTAPGMILGTVSYMSPEQARSKPADKRADIWAFGCVLYEMVAGKRAFDGEDAAVALAAVIKGEPDWAALPADTPMPVLALLRGALKRDWHTRIADIGVATFVLDHASQLVERVDGSGSSLQAPALSRARRWRRATGVAVAIGIGALLAGAGVYLLMRPAPHGIVRTAIVTSASTELRLIEGGRDIAITPDGSRIVYRGDNQLLVRALNQLEPAVLSGLGVPQGVFISPDGQWVGFFDGTAMKKVAIAGGSPVIIATVDGDPRGATWGADGTIIFATATDLTALQRVPAAGGTPAVLTTADRVRGDADHQWPEFLPGGKAVLFTIIFPNRSLANAQVAVLDLQSGVSKVLIRGGSDAHYLPSGHLVYGAAGALRAVPFDLRQLEVVGEPVPVLDGVTTTTRGAAAMAVAANGSLVYVPGLTSDYDQRTVVAVDRQGHSAALPDLPLDSYRDVRISPDGKSLALATQSQVLIYGFANHTLRRLTAGSGGWDRSPLWTPDSQQIIFTSDRHGYQELFIRSADGTGEERPFIARAKGLIDLRANGWSADDKRLLLSEVPVNLHNSISEVVFGSPSDGRVLVNSNFSNDSSAVSPDGHWFAYHSRSRVADLSEIYVERYPELGRRQQLSTGGGRMPLWSRTGRELFYMSADARHMLAVPVRLGTDLVAGRPVVLFDYPMLPQGGGNLPYDVMQDGSFVIIRSERPETAAAPSANLILVQNWFEELKRLVPVK